MKHAALYKEATVESRTIFSMCIYACREYLYRTYVTGDYYGLYVSSYVRRKLLYEV